MRIPAGYGQINWRFAGEGLPRGAEVTMGFFNVESEEDPVAIAATALATFQDAWLSDLASTITLMSCLVKLGPNTTGDFGEFVQPQAGGEAAESGSPVVAILCRKRTGFGGRTGRGRCYIPGLPESGTEPDGTIPGTSLETYRLDAEEWLANLQGAGLSPVVLHGESTSSDLVPHTITSLDVDSRVGTQRRRLRG